jgi:hypothetical protein
MATDKRTFKGGMNKDVDQRLLPDDQYREGTNIRNMQGRDGTMGVITPIPANIKKSASFSFGASEPVGGKTVITMEPVNAGFAFGGGNNAVFDFTFTITGGTSYSTSIDNYTITEEMYGGQMALYTDFDAEIAKSYAFAALFGQAIQSKIDADSTLAGLLQVSVVANIITVQLFDASLTMNATIIAVDASTNAFSVSDWNTAKFPVGQAFTAGAGAWDGIVVGSVADEIDRRIYYLLHQTLGDNKKDYIVQYDEDTDLLTIIYEELQGSTSGFNGHPILNFSVGRMVHSINLIDQKYLYFTDGLTAPKKINISKCMNGLLWRKTYSKVFSDNNFARAIPGGVGGNFAEAGFSSNLVFVFPSNPSFKVNEIIYVEQDEGYAYEEYNGYFKVVMIEELDGTYYVAVDFPFISSSPAIPGQAWGIQYWNDSYVQHLIWRFDPRVHYFPEAFSNIFKGLKGRYFNAHKPAPLDRATYTYITDTTKKKNNVFGSVWQFAYRYIYDDNEVSALSLISDVVIPEEMAVNSSAGLNYEQHNNNAIRIVIPQPSNGSRSLQNDYIDSDLNEEPSITDPVYLHNFLNTAGDAVETENTGISRRLHGFASCIAAVEIYARKRNDAPFVLIEKVESYTHKDTFENAIYPKQSEVILNKFVVWDDIVIDFYNDGIYPLLDSRNAEKLYDWTPHIAETQTVIDNSAILYANVTDGFDQTAMDATVDSKFLSSDDADNPTAAEHTGVGFTEAFSSYITSAPSSIGDSSWGYPDALSESGSAQQNQGMSAGGALVHFGGKNSESNRYNRCRVQLYVGNVPMNDAGTYVEKGTVFTSSGSFNFIYKWGRLWNNSDRYGIKYTWDSVSHTCSDDTTTVATFMAAIVAKFEALPTQTNPNDGDTDGGFLSWEEGTNYRNTEIYAGGTDYNASQKVITVHFRSTIESAHQGGLVVNAKLEHFSASTSSKFAVLPESRSSFKTGAFHDFGIVYGNERNQTSYVNKSADTRTYVKFLTERGDTDKDNPAQTDALGLPVINWEIKHRPPEWAEWYQWVYAGNTSVDEFIQFTSEDAAINYNDGNDENIYLNFNPLKGKPYSYMKQDSPKIDYVFSENDRIRFIKNSGGTISTYIDIPLQEAVVFNHQDDEDINHVRKFYDQKYTDDEHRDKAASGYFLVFKAPQIPGFRKSDVVPSTSVTNGYKDLLFEIYSPKKQIEDGPTFYYGLTDKIAIEYTGNYRRHAAPQRGKGFQDQKATDIAEVPAKGYFTQGDIYLKGRKTITRRSADFNTIHHVNFCEGYYANDYIDSKSYNKGRKHAYNVFAKEQKRPTTVYFSGPYLPSSNVNGLSEFNLIDLPFKEYSISYGPIEKTLSKDSDLILMQSNKVSKVLVAKQVLLGATGQANVALSDQILSEATPYQGDYGPAYAGESAIMYGGKVYFTDPVRGVMCRLGGDGLTVISDYGMKSYFLGYFRARTKTMAYNSPEKYLNNISGYDPENGEYLYYGKAWGVRDLLFDPSEYPNKLIGFYEKSNKYVSFYSYEPECIQNLGSNLYTFKGGYIYLHNRSDVKLDYNKFYGATDSANSTLSVVFNGQSSVVKTFDNIGIEGTKPWTPVTLETDNFKSTFQTANGNIHAPGGANYWQRKEGFYYMPTPLGKREEFDYYEDKVSNSYVGVGTVVYTSPTVLTSSVDVSAFVKVGSICDLFFTATSTGTFTISGIDTTGKILTGSFAATPPSFVADSNYFLAINSDPLGKGIEGEKPRGVFAECSFYIKPSELTYTTSDQDTIELHAMDMELKPSPVSYK